MNTYSYAFNNPINLFDSLGLKVELRCRSIGGFYDPSLRSRVARMFGGEHCYLVVSCPEKSISETHISYLGPVQVVPRGGAHNNDTIYSASGNYRNIDVDPPAQEIECNDCEFEQCVLTLANDLRGMDYRVENYSVFGPNSNSFARFLITSCGGDVGATNNEPYGWNDHNDINL